MLKWVLWTAVSLWLPIASWASDEVCQRAFGSKKPPIAEPWPETGSRQNDFEQFDEHASTSITKVSDEAVNGAFQTQLGLGQRLQIHGTDKIAELYRQFALQMIDTPHHNRVTGANDGYDLTVQFVPTDRGTADISILAHQRSKPNNRPLTAMLFDQQRLVTGISTPLQTVTLTSQGSLITLRHYFLVKSDSPNVLPSIRERIYTMDRATGRGTLRLYRARFTDKDVDVISDENFELRLVQPRN
jgi:hypothetical protein